MELLVMRAVFTIALFVSSLMADGKCNTGRIEVFIPAFVENGEMHPANTKCVDKEKRNWKVNDERSINQKIMDSQMKPYNDAKKRGDI